MIIGSSNLSRSTLTQGVEWNVAMDSDASPTTYHKALSEFMQLFLHEQTVAVNQETIVEYQQLYDHYHRENPNLVRVWTKAEEVAVMLSNRAKEQEEQYVIETTGVYEHIAPKSYKIVIVVHFLRSFSLIIQTDVKRY